MNNLTGRKRGFVIWLVVLIAVAAITAGAYFVTNGFSDFSIIGLAAGGNALNFVAEEPRDRVADGLVSLFVDQPNPLFEAQLGQSEIAEKIAESGAEIDATINNLQLPIVGQSFGLELPPDAYLRWHSSKTKVPARARLNLTLGVADKALLSLSAFSADHLLQLASTQLSDTVIGIDTTGDVAAKIDKAPLLADMTAEQRRQLISFLAVSQGGGDLYREIADIEKLIAKLKTYTKLYSAFSDYKEKWLVDQIDGRAFTVDGKAIDCDGYDLRITIESTFEFLNELRTVLREDEMLRKDLDGYYEQLAPLLGSAEQPIETREQYYAKIDQLIGELFDMVKKYDGPDPVFTIYLDDQNRAINFFINYQYEAETVTLSIEKRGGATLSENMTAEYTVSDGQETGKISLQRSGQTRDEACTAEFNLAFSTEQSDDFSLTTKMMADFKANQWQYELTGNLAEQVGHLAANGRFADIKKGEHYQIEVDQLQFDLNEQLLLGLAGSLSINGAVAQVDQISDDYSDLLKMTRDEAKQLLRELQSNGLMLLLSL